MVEVVLVPLVVLALYARVLSSRTYGVREGVEELHDANLTMLCFPTLNGPLQEEEEGEAGVDGRDRAHYTR